MFIKRIIFKSLQATLDNSKSILLLAPRKTGKTTLIKKLSYDIYINLLEPKVRLDYESNPDKLINEIRAEAKIYNKKPLVIIDEIQKIPELTDSIQLLIDDNVAQFILTGSSARKIQNLLPGRVICYHMPALLLSELDSLDKDNFLYEILEYGLLPEVFSIKSSKEKEELLSSYVGLYLEEEIRKEALVRNLSSFANFLRIAAIESGNLVNIQAISQDVGVANTTIKEYYRILEDCLIVYKIEALTNNPSRKKLTKAPKYLFFDLGVRRVAANEIFSNDTKILGRYFEQFVGIEIFKILQTYNKRARLLFWRDHAGPEVDYIIEFNNQYIAIEIKWTSNPKDKDLKNLKKFKDLYANTVKAYVVCQVDRPQLVDDIMIISWKDLDIITKDII